MENEHGQIGEAESELGNLTYTVDSFDNGVVFGQHKLPAGQDPRDCYALGLQDGVGLARLRSRYALNRDNPYFELEKNLMRLSRQGVLRAATIYFGTTTDPFFPFDGKFDGSMKFLEIFKKYVPGQLIIQTRSPLIVIALPVLKKLGVHASVTLGIETSCEESVKRYTPGLPRVLERLKTAMALRRFGVDVSLQVGPVLPYGDWRADASKFAQVLVENGDRVYVRSITDGTDFEERRIRQTDLAKLLAEDRKFHWLRPDSAKPLLYEIAKLAPEKLRAPAWEHLKDRQMKMFAA